MEDISAGYLRRISNLLWKGTAQSYESVTDKRRCPNEHPFTEFKQVAELVPVRIRICVCTGAWVRGCVGLSACINLHFEWTWNALKTPVNDSQSRSWRLFLDTTTTPSLPRKRPLGASLRLVQRMRTTQRSCVLHAQGRGIQREKPFRTTPSFPAPTLQLVRGAVSFAILILQMHVDGRSVIHLQL